MATSKEPVPISGVCAVFAESEVINQLSQGASPADIMHGAIVSLVDRSVQLMKRVQLEPEFTLIGGILRFETMARVVSEHLKSNVNVPAGDRSSSRPRLAPRSWVIRDSARLREGGAQRPVPVGEFATELADRERMC